MLSSPPQLNEASFYTYFQLRERLDQAKALGHRHHLVECSGDDFLGLVAAYEGLALPVTLAEAGRCVRERFCLGGLSRRGTPGRRMPKVLAGLTGTSDDYLSEGELDATGRTPGVTDDDRPTVKGLRRMPSPSTGPVCQLQPNEKETPSTPAISTSHDRFRAVHKPMPPGIDSMHTTLGHMPSSARTMAAESGASAHAGKHSESDTMN
jgi:hypothetical protein